MIEKEIYDAWFEEHEFPTVRIHHIELNNFKSVRYGKIDTACSFTYVPYGTKADILGVYGQNGSGKTALIDALTILKSVMSGSRVNPRFAECISVWATSSRLSFVFDLQYPNGDIRTFEYAFSIKAIVNEESSDNKLAQANSNENSDDENRCKVIVFDEQIKISGTFSGEKHNTGKVHTSEKNDIFGKKDKNTLFFHDITKDDKINLLIINRMSEDKSLSFIFNKETLKMMNNKVFPYYVQVLREMYYYANDYLYIVRTQDAGFIRMGMMIPFHTFAFGVAPIRLDRPFLVPNDDLESLQFTINATSNVLQAIIPGLTVELVKRQDTSLEDGEPAAYTELISYRSSNDEDLNCKMPFRYESDGVRRLFSFLFLIICAYNQQSITLAVDEFDSGIFEYLLGEILTIFQESGKGQFIFTSHNLRPLEVIDRRFLVFTTTNPDNRYYRLKGISTTSNLRSSYFREIILGEQDETLYNSTKKYKIVSALRKANIFGASAAWVGNR